jgi:hypothetical protein
MTGRVPLAALVALALAVIMAGPAIAQSPERRYAVELLDHSGRIIAAGSMTVTIDADAEPRRTERIEGHHRFDRSEPGAPPFMDNGKVYGQVWGRRMIASLAVPLIDRVQIEANFFGPRRDRFTGEWRYSTCARFTSGVVQAYAME